jgi:hypothetical protein
MPSKTSRTPKAKSDFPQPNKSAKQKFGQGRKKGVLNQKTLMQRASMAAALVEENVDPHLFRVQMLKHLTNEIFPTLTATKDKFTAMFLMDQILDKIDKVLHPIRVTEDDPTALIPLANPSTQASDEDIAEFDRKMNGKNLVILEGNAANTDTNQDT